jgi:hypothetical protein
MPFDPNELSQLVEALAPRERRKFRNPTEEDYSCIARLYGLYHQAKAIQKHQWATATSHAERMLRVASRQGILQGCIARRLLRDSAYPFTPPTGAPYYGTYPDGTSSRQRRGRSPFISAPIEINRRRH